MLAALLLLAGSHLVEALQATDSGTRLRAAYALARVHDPADSAQAAAVTHLLEAGIPTEKQACVEGLLDRHWPLSNGMPDALVDLLYGPVFRGTDVGRMGGDREAPARSLLRRTLADGLDRLPPARAREIATR